MIDFDFHIHCAPQSSCASQTLQEAIEQAAAAGIKVLSLCNHNTVEGLEEAKKECDKRGIEFVNGIEISVSIHSQNEKIDNKVIHLLGYNYRLEKTVFEEFFKELNINYDKYIEEFSTYLIKKGYIVSGAKSMREIRQVLVKKGYFQTEKDAKQFLRVEQTQSRIPDEKCSLEGAMQLIKNAGGLVIWAHPNNAEHHLPIEEEEIVEILNILCANGLDGIEVFHPNTVEEVDTVNFLLDIAKEKKLLITLGSDTHNAQKQYFNKRQWVKNYAYDFNKIRYFWRK